jgi:hypothetical protein
MAVSAPQDMLARAGHQTARRMTASAPRQLALGRVRQTPSTLQTPAAVAVRSGMLTNKLLDKPGRKMLAVLVYLDPDTGRKAT